MLEDRPVELARPRPSLLALARTWVAIGSQSLGGGPSTLYMMRSLLVERHGWLDARVFRECWAIGQASPGMHLIALSGLLGERLAGLPGIVVSVTAMVLPAALITILLTAGLVEIEQHPLVQSMLRGVVPATGGMTLAMAVFFGRTSARKGRVAVVDWLLVTVAALLAGLARLPVLLILAGLAMAGAFILRPVPADLPRRAGE